MVGRLFTVDAVMSTRPRVSVFMKSYFFLFGSSRPEQYKYGIVAMVVTVSPRCCLSTPLIVQTTSNPVMNRFGSIILIFTLADLGPSENDENLSRH